MEKDTERHIQFSDGTEIVLRGLFTLINSELLQHFATIFSGFVNIIIEGASKVDWRAFIDGRWTRHIVLRFADEATEREDITESEKADLSRDVEEFKSCIDQIIRCDDKCDKRAALIAIERAVMIGAESRVPPEKLKEIQQEFKRRQAAIARQGKTAKTANLKAAIIADAEENNRTLAISEQFARMILPGVREKLGLPPAGSDWPQWRAVKDGISAIKKDRTKRNVLTKDKT
jgi:hypothetical protein